MRAVKINDIFRFLDDALNHEKLMNEETFDALAVLSTEMRRVFNGGEATVQVRECVLSGFFLCIHDVILNNPTMGDAAMKALNVLSRAFQTKLVKTPSGILVTYADGSRVRFSLPMSVGHC